MMVYVYKEYDDYFAYGEEIIKIFGSLEKAKEHLKGQVMKNFGLSEFKKPAIFGEDDSFEEDYVTFTKDDGSTEYWIVEGHPVL